VDQPDSKRIDRHVDRLLVCAGWIVLIMFPAPGRR
jgi:hypothetical protein